MTIRYVEYTAQLLDHSGNVEVEYPKAEMALRPQDKEPPARCLYCGKQLFENEWDHSCDERERYYSYEDDN